MIKRLASSASFIIMFFCTFYMTDCLAADTATPYDAAADSIAGFLPEKPQGLGYPITDRDAWNAVRSQYPKDVERIVKDAEKLITTPIPEAPESLYKDYYQTGNRTRYQAVNSARSGRLSTLVIAECLMNEGKFLPAIEASLADHLAYPSWVLPAHDQNAEIYDGKAVYADLASTAFSWQLATTDYWLGERLQPATRAKIRSEIERRTFAPYRKSLMGGDKYNWWINTENNWNAVCHAGVVGAALALIDLPKERAFYVAAAAQKSEPFLNGFTSDGYCSEGLGYWNYGFGNFVDMAETVRRATRGNVDWIREMPKVRTVALFGPKMEISSGIYGTFADCAISAKPDSLLLSRLNEQLHLGLPGYSLRLAPSLPWNPVGLGLFGFPVPERSNATDANAEHSTDSVEKVVDSASTTDLAADASSVGGIRETFPDAGVYVFRPEMDSEHGKTCTQRTDQLAMIVKGGHNAEMHNHNDVGSYTITLGGKSPILDPGGEIYTSRTFSGKRYESNALNSFGHGVPRIAGKLQKTGAAAKGIMQRNLFTDVEDVIYFDLTSTYDVPTLKQASRVFTFDRRLGQTKEAQRKSDMMQTPDGGLIRIVDIVEFTEPNTFETAFLSYEKWEKLTEGDEAKELEFRIGEGAAAVRVTVSAATQADDANQRLRFTADTIDEDMMSCQKPTRFGFALTQPATQLGIRVVVKKWTESTDSQRMTDWLSANGRGVFMHFLPGSSEDLQQVESFDVEALADQLAAVDAQYFVLTIYQNSGWFNAPNAEYDTVVGWQPGERCAKRDLPMELADALAKRNIRLMLYVTAQTPNRDTQAQRAYGLKEGPADQPIDVAFAKKWAKVFQEWSDRYGTKVCGWWVDGCYEWVNFNDEIGQIYGAALKHGNPQAIVALNPGVLRPEWKPSDYTAGEINEPLGIAMDGRWSQGQQVQILTFLGDSWGRPNCRYTDAQWTEWMHTIRAKGGAVTLDANSNMNPDAGAIGRLNDEQFRQLQSIFRAVQEGE